MALQPDERCVCGLRRLAVLLEVTYLGVNAYEHELVFVSRATSE